MPALGTAHLPKALPAWAQPQAWLERGQDHESQGDLRSAAYCYYLALEFGRCQLALEGLARLGYLDIR